MRAITDKQISWAEEMEDRDRGWTNRQYDQIVDLLPKAIERIRRTEKARDYWQELYECTDANFARLGEHIKAIAAERDAAQRQLLEIIEIWKKMRPSCKYFTHVGLCGLKEGACLAMRDCPLLLGADGERT